jgi:hypothetical protein
MIKYVYDPFNYMEPSVGRIICDSGWINCREDTAAYRLSRHYFAMISVYKIKQGKNELIGSPFSGYYVVNGCFEDVPEAEVKEAKNLQRLIDENKVLQIKNGMNARYKYVVTWKDYKTGLDKGWLIGTTNQIITTGTTGTVTGSNYVVIFDPSSTISTFTPRLNFTFSLFLCSISMLFIF